jgi:SEC-C motif-containing protein
MRSRYSAFVVGDAEYLLHSWHASTRPKALSFESNQKWLWLKVLDAKATGSDTAEVEFIACYRVGGGSALRMQERSRFVKEGEQWLYVGPVSPP